MLTNGWLKECLDKPQIFVQILKKEPKGKIGNILLSVSDGEHIDDAVITPSALKADIDAIDIHTIVQITKFKCIFEQYGTNSKKRVMVLLAFEKKEAADRQIGTPKLLTEEDKEPIAESVSKLVRTTSDLRKFLEENKVFPR